MNILEAITEEKLFRPFLTTDGGSLSSWSNWRTALACLYGHEFPKKYGQIVTECTGRTPASLPSNGFDTALFLTGRRSGKSRMAGVIAAYESCLSGRHRLLAKGETGMVAILSPTKSQSRIAKNYVKGVFENSPILKNEIWGEQTNGFSLSNGVRIEIVAGDWRTIRGYSLLAAIVDEAAFFGVDAESKVKSDSELMRAIQPSLATTGGKLIAISSPYARRGWCYSQYQKHFGSSGPTLVWNDPSRVMNPTLPQAIVDRALADDLASAKAEYLGEFRDDVAAYLDRKTIERCVVDCRSELPPEYDTTYSSFADLSGGRSDDAALAVAHYCRESRVHYLDCLKRWTPPFDPNSVIQEMCQVLEDYGVRRVTGDRYAAEFVSTAFQRHGIKYEPSPKNKSELYVDLLPLITSQSVELLDDQRLVDQLSNLERRTRSGGKDIIDHPAGGHDDVANVVAGVCSVASTKKIRIGAL